ncbi:putative Inflorescence deficient in abscission-like 2 [Hibiscus syriacus]|uniref:U-box domain-containing protein n=1 Tax=Hibiscus syriacus TaxID=106335 RepID=A0A6A2WIA7_HIBSY|nr:putative Inflorescence deficient in abscission-like 2 [Hibiscus syriacus]
MKSPVSLCTGVTYDRSSIQQWLESGHDTCSATMQVLPSKDFIPNLTLRRIINLWIQSSTLRPGANSPRLLPAISEVRAKLLKEKIESQCCVESLSKVVEFACHCEENRRFVVRFDGFVEVVAGVLRRKFVEIKALEMAVGILNLNLSENGVKERLNKLILKSNQERNFLSKIVFVLRNGSPYSKVKSVRVLDSLDSTQNPNAESPTHKILYPSSYTSSKQTMTEILLNSSMIEKSLKLLATLSSSSEGMSTISSNTKCAATVVEKLLEVSNRRRGCNGGAVERVLLAKRGESEGS